MSSHAAKTKSLRVVEAACGCGHPSFGHYPSLHDRPGRTSPAVLVADDEQDDRRADQGDADDDHGDGVGRTTP